MPYYLSYIRVPYMRLNKDEQHDNYTGDRWIERNGADILSMAN
jgi:hypothetical protein